MNSRKRNLLLAGCALGLAAGFAAASMPRLEAMQAVELMGAGSTFVNPIMQQWIADFKTAHSSVSINYQSIGSGGGIKAVHDQTVDFGASDASLSDEQLKDYSPLIQLPESAGPVCITYNVTGLQKPLRLSAAALSGIFLGTITNWNDPAIAKTNPGENLPNTAVAVAHRSDGSGTSNIFTLYLSAVSPEWKSKVGAGASPNWPAGIGGKGSEGVTGIVKQMGGGIGYVELTYATANKLPVAEIQNAAGQFVAPSADSASAALAASMSTLSADVRTPIVNASGGKSYPITGLTFLIVPMDGKDAGKRQALKDFIAYVITKGQTVSTGLGYAPLPSSIQQLDQKMLGQLKADGKALK